MSEEERSAGAEGSKDLGPWIDHNRRMRHLLSRLAPHAETYIGGVDSGRVEELAHLILEELHS